MNEMDKFEYQFLTDMWDGPPGAAYNQTYEFCRETGWCDSRGKPTAKGEEALEEYLKKDFIL